MKKQIMLGGLLLLLGSCTPQNKANDPNAIDIAVSLEHLTELKTSQLGKQIRYIPLETTDSSLIGNSYSIKLSKDHIFVSTNGRCLSFNKQTGKYLGSIGLEAFQRIASHPKLQGLPFVMETPNDDAGWAKEIAMMRAFADAMPET